MPMLLHAIPSVFLDARSVFRPSLSVVKTDCVVLNPYGAAIFTRLRFQFT